jgi:hypothetical protein
MGAVLIHRYARDSIVDPNLIDCLCQTQCCWGHDDVVAVFVLVKPMELCGGDSTDDPCPSGCSINAHGRQIGRDQGRWLLHFGLLVDGSHRVPGHSQASSTYTTIYFTKGNIWKRFGETRNGHSGCSNVCKREWILDRIPHFSQDLKHLGLFQVRCSWCVSYFVWWDMLRRHPSCWKSTRRCSQFASCYFWALPTMY